MDRGGTFTSVELNLTVFLVVCFTIIKSYGVTKVIGYPLQNFVLVDFRFKKKIPIVKHFCL